MFRAFIWVQKVITLDDNVMNLQSLSASRFVGPFVDKVQKWEKSLSHISEVVDVSMRHLIYTTRVIKLL